MNQKNKDTIIALATSSGVGAIAVIRLSGEKSIEITNQFFQSKFGNKDLNNISLYPNPANNVINLQSNVLINELVIYNTLGQKMISNTPTQENTSVDISSLQSGIFFVKVKWNDTYKTFKFVKE